MLATSANGQPAAAACTRDRHGGYQPYGIRVLTVTSQGIRRVHSFAGPGLITLSGFQPNPLPAAPLVIFAWRQDTAAGIVRVRGDDLG